MDLFSLGLVLFFCMTEGDHPFGDHIKRDANISNDKKDLFALDQNPEAVDLIASLLKHNPKLRYILGEWQYILSYLH